MATANALRALDPIWFRFADPEDIETYGGRWYSYDEGAIVRLPARDLIALETELGMPLVAMMNGFRDSSILGDTAVAWTGVHLVDPNKAGDFDEFNPKVMTIEWTKVDPGPKEIAGLENTHVREVSDSLTPSSSETMTSAPMDTVSLPVMPWVGSGA